MAVGSAVAVGRRARPPVDNRGRRELCEEYCDWQVVCDIWLTLLFSSISLQKLTNDESNPSSSAVAASVASAEAAADQEGEDKDGDSKKKKNRCAVCRKKVGLTGA